MSSLLNHLGSVVAVASLLTLGATSAAVAEPACADPVAGTLHTVHETSGDPAGLAHEAEETYCGVKP